MNSYHITCGNEIIAISKPIFGKHCGFDTQFVVAFLLPVFYFETGKVYAKKLKCGQAKEIE